jgi:hypothetical protein
VHRPAAPPEPGVDTGALLAAATARAADGDGDGHGVDAVDAAAFDDGPVECEPLPGDVVTAADVEGARCSSTLQPDGSSLYVVERPDGTRTTVRFGPGTAAAADHPGGTSLTVTPRP